MFCANRYTNVPKGTYKGGVQDQYRFEIKEKEKTIKKKQNNTCKIGNITTKINESKSDAISIYNDYVIMLQPWLI